MFLKLFYRFQKYKTRQIKINKKKYNAYVADSMIKKMIGLMFRKRLESKKCMLFIFGGNGFYKIWMHNMEFAIDVIWLDDKWRVTDIKENLQPCRKSVVSCEEFGPQKESKYIIELNSGEIKRNGITKNSKISIN